MNMIEHTRGFNVRAYEQLLNTFPDITFAQFCELDDISVRQEIIKRNKILQTDTYNRTMWFLRWEKWKKVETFSLSLRRSTNDKYNIVYWVQKILKEVFGTPITQQELDFAKDFYAAEADKWWISYFDADMWQNIIDSHNWYIPLEIKAVEDWTALKPKEPMMTITWIWELAAVFEPVLLRVFYQSVVATETHMIEEIISQWRMIEVWKRAAVNEQQHLDWVEATMVWMWLTLTSNDAAAAVYPSLKTTWTTWHRYFASFNGEEEWFENAIQKVDRIALLVDLVESYAWIDKVIALKKKYRHTWKSIAIRLDSWDITDQAIYALKKLQENDMLDPNLDKIIIEDLSSVEQIARIEKSIEFAWFDPKKFIVYGAWSLLLIKNKLRDTVSAWYKLINTEEWPTWKLSNDIDKQPVPWLPNVEIRLEDWKRFVVQEDENVQWERLLKTVYKNGEFSFPVTWLRAIERARTRLAETLSWTNLETFETHKTQEVRRQVSLRLKWTLS